MVNEMDVLFAALKKFAQQQTGDQSKPGFGGGWTPEAIYGADLIKFTMYDGGYTQIVQSEKFNFRLFQSNSDKETKYSFTSGTIDDAQRCLDFLQTS